MIDPLAQVVSLLQPRAAYSKLASGAGAWSVQRSETGRPFYCAVLEGACRLLADGHAPLILRAGDFVLLPAVYDFTMSSLQPPPDDYEYLPHLVAEGVVRLGDPDQPADVRVMIGYCEFTSSDSALLVSLLPQLIYVSGEKRLATLVELVRDESRSQRHAREVVLERLLEVLFIEALRSSAGLAGSPGLLRGLSDDALAPAIRLMHENPAHPWTIAELAGASALSRTSFFERFSQLVGKTPKEYLLAWRMALAKQILRREALSVAEIAERVGYSSASTFTVAFTRFVGTPPGRYGRYSSLSSDFP